MDEIILPIDVVQGTNPPKFRWSQTVNMPDGGKQSIMNEGPLPPSVEVAVEKLIGIVKQLLMDNAVLHGRIKGMEDRTVATATLSQPVQKKGKN